MEGVASVPVVGSVVSSNNSTTAALGAAGVFTGNADSLLPYAGTTINLAGAAASAAPGTLFFEYSPDGTHWDVSVPLTIADVNLGMIPMPLRTVLPFFRVRYVNGAVAQTQMRLTTVHHYNAPEILTRFLNQALGSGEPIKTFQAVGALEYAAALGTFDNALMTSRRTALSEPPPLTLAQSSVINVGTSAVRLDGTPFPNRVAAEVHYPLSTAHTQGGTVDGIVRVGWNNAVSMVGNSRELQPGEAWQFDAGVALQIWAIANNAAQPITLTEFAP